MNMTMTATEFKKQLPRILPTELVVFLKKEKVFRAYTNNCYACVKNKSREDIQVNFDDFNDVLLKDIIPSSFTWYHTKEGHMFWRGLNQKFVNSLKV